MKTEQLEQLLKVLECGSISKAARKLYISQPSLTKNIAQLESENGIKILTRTSKGIELTEEGINFVFYAKQILTATNGLNNAFRNNHADCSRLFLASQEFDFLADILHELYVENTDNHVHYNILEVDRGEVILRVLNRRSDIGLIVSYGEHEKKQMWMRDAALLDMCPLAEGEVIVCVGPNSAYYNKERLTIEDARNALTICLDVEAQAKENLYFEIADHGFNTNRIMFFNSIHLCEEMLLKTDSVMFVSEWTKNCMTNPSLHFIPVDLPRKTKLLCCTRKGESLSIHSLQFLRKLYRHFEKEDEFLKFYSSK